MFNPAENCTNIALFIPFVSKNTTFLQVVLVGAEWIAAPRRLTENQDYTGYDHIARVGIFQRLMVVHLVYALVNASIATFP